MNDTPVRLSDLPVSDPMPGTVLASKFTEEKAEEVCRRIAEGETLADICRSPHMPSRAMVWKWLEANPSFRGEYARARERQAHAFVEEIVATARGATQEDHAAARVKVDALKWVAARLNAHDYGDKLDIKQSGTLAMTVVSGVPRGPEDPPTIDHEPE